MEYYNTDFALSTPPVVTELPPPPPPAPPAQAPESRFWRLLRNLEAAAQAFVQEVVQGTPVSDAVTAFCEEVLDYVSPPAADQVPDEG